MGNRSRPESVDALILGFAVHGLGATRIIADGRMAAKGHEQAAMRLSAEERHARLAELREALYQAEIAEERHIEEHGGERRPDANIAAVLGVPWQVAQEHGFAEARS